MAHGTLFFMKRRDSLHSPWLFFYCNAGLDQEGFEARFISKYIGKSLNMHRKCTGKLQFLEHRYVEYHGSDVSKEVAGFGHLKYDYFKTEHFLICTYIYSSSFYLLINKKGPTLINFIFSIAKSVRT